MIRFAMSAEASMNLDSEQFVSHMSASRYCAWRYQVEALQVSLCARQALSSVPESTWQDRFAANDDAFSAVIEELGRAED